MCDRLYMGNSNKIFVSSLSMHFLSIFDKHLSNTEERVMSGYCLFAGLYVLLGKCCLLPDLNYRQKPITNREGSPFRVTSK